MYDEVVIRPDEIITYGSLVKEDMREYHNIVDSKRWEPTDNKKISKSKPLLLKSSTVEIEDQVNKTVEKVHSKSARMGNTITLE